MGVKKINIVAFCLYTLLPIWVLWRLITDQLTDWQTLLIALLFTVVPWFIGLFIGIGLAAMVKKPWIEQYLYAAAHGAVLTTLLSFVLFTINDENGGHSETSTRSSNHDLVDYNYSTFPEHPRRYVKTAFKKLEGEFTNPNSFLLTNYFCSWKDTTIDKTRDTFYIVNFRYLKQNKLLYSQYAVFGDSAAAITLASADEPRQPYGPMQPGVWGRLGDLGTVKRYLKDLPDSTQKQALAIFSH